MPNGLNSDFIGVRRFRLLMGRICWDLDSTMLGTGIAAEALGCEVWKQICFKCSACHETTLCTEHDLFVDLSVTGTTLEARRSEHFFPKQVLSWMGFSSLARNGLCSLMICWLLLVPAGVPVLVSLLLSSFFPQERGFHHGFFWGVEQTSARWKPRCNYCTFKISLLQFPLQNRGAGTPKTFDFGEPSCTPTLLQNQRPWGGKHPKTTHFWHFWTVSW